MKKFLTILLTISCFMILGACSTDKVEEQPYIIGKVIEVNETEMLVEITNKGNCTLEVGKQVFASTEKIKGVLDTNPETVTENYIRIEFNGMFAEEEPPHMGEIFKIDITDENGTSIE